MLVVSRRDCYDRGMSTRTLASARPSRRSLAAVLVVAVTASVGAACGTTGGSGVTVSAGARSETTGPAAPTQPVATTTAPAITGPSAQLPLYFVRDGKLAVGRRFLPADVNLVNHALSSLLAGPTEAEAAAGMSTAIPSLTRVHSTAVMGDVVVINVSGSFAALGPVASSELRLAQIVYTVSVFPVRVLLQIDGQPARSIGGFVLPDRPLTRDDFAPWTPPVLLESVGPDDVLTAATEISGTVAAANANIGVRVTDAAGQVLFEGTTRSARGKGARHLFRTSAAFVPNPPGPGTLTVWELEPEPGATPVVLTLPVQLA